MDPSHRRFVDATVSDHPTAHGASLHSQDQPRGHRSVGQFPLIRALRGSANRLPIDQHIHMIDAALDPIAEATCIAELTGPFDRSLTVLGMATPDPVDKSEALAGRRAEAFGVLLPHRSPSTRPVRVRVRTLDISLTPGPQPDHELGDRAPPRATSRSSPTARRLRLMCGRIALYDDPDHLARLLDAGVDPELMATWRPSWNVGPTAPILGVSERHGQRILDAYKWGLVPSWAKNPAAVKGTFNARARDHRHQTDVSIGVRTVAILVPADSFYEMGDVGPKQTALRVQTGGRRAGRLRRTEGVVAGCRGPRTTNGNDHHDRGRTGHAHPQSSTRRARPGELGPLA